jgi:xylose dehydrogenase (NAD/NADP)
MELASLLEEPTARPWTPTGEGRLRFAVVGVGWWAREYALPALVDGENTIPTTLVTGSPEEAADLRESYPSVGHVLDYEAFADGEESEAYDAAYVCTPNGTHLEQVRAAAGNGKDVVCEKPLEAGVERAEKLVEAVESAGTRLMTAYRMQADPTVRKLRALLREGLVGDPVVVHAHMGQRLLDFFDDGGWRLDTDLVGRGVSVTDLGVYPLNTTRFLLDTDPVRVSATGHSAHEDFADVPDERATFELTMDDGTVAACSVAQNAQLSGWLNIAGTEGSVELSPAFFGNDEQLLKLSLGEQTHEIRYTPVDQMREEFVLFADRVLSGEPIEADGEHTLVDMYTVEAVYDAIESGDHEPVPVPGRSG